MQIENRYCEECGEQLTANTDHCGHCGTASLDDEELSETDDDWDYASGFQPDRTLGRVFAFLIVLTLVAIIIVMNTPSTGPNRASRSEVAEAERQEPLSEPSKAIACRAAIALLNGRSPSSVEARPLGGDLFHVTHRSPEDNIVWQSRCQHLSRGTLMWAAFDPFRDGAGQGRWRTEDSIQFEMNPDRIQIVIATQGQGSQRRTYNRSEFE